MDDRLSAAIPGLMRRGAPVKVTLSRVEGVPDVVIDGVMVLASRVAVCDGGLADVYTLGDTPRDDVTEADVTLDLGTRLGRQVALDWLLETAIRLQASRSVPSAEPDPLASPGPRPEDTGAEEHGFIALCQALLETPGSTGITPEQSARLLARSVLRMAVGGQGPIEGVLVAVSEGRGWRLGKVQVGRRPKVFMGTHAFLHANGMLQLPPIHPPS